MGKEEEIERWITKVEHMEKLLSRAKIQLVDKNLSNATMHIGELSHYFLRNIFEEYVELKISVRAMWKDEDG